MKKILSILMSAAFFNMMAYAQENVVELKGGFSPAPRFDVSPSKEGKASYEIGAEYRYRVTENTEIGGGIAYQKHGKLKGFTDIDTSTLRVDVLDMELYDSVPLYATVRYSFRNTTSITPYVKANIGYSFNINNKNHSNYETYNKTTGALVDSGKLKELTAESGMYYAVGAGIEYRGLTVDLSYQITRADMKGVRYDGAQDSGTADNRRITLGIGYQFSF